ncbi:MAG: 50S ribosomal protein L21 [Enterobacteriaceae bacterium]
MYAIIAFNGKQYKIRENKSIFIDAKISAKNIKFNNVLLYVNNDITKIGCPFLNDINVLAKVVKVVKGKKISVIKFKRRKNYKKIINYRTWISEIKILSIFNK